MKNPNAFSLLTVKFSQYSKINVCKNGKMGFLDLRVFIRCLTIYLFLAGLPNLSLQSSASQIFASAWNEAEQRTNITLFNRYSSADTITNAKGKDQLINGKPLHHIQSYLIIQYGISNDWQLGAQVPFELYITDRAQHGSLAALGDFRPSIQYQAWRSDTGLSALSVAADLGVPLANYTIDELVMPGDRQLDSNFSLEYGKSFFWGKQLMVFTLQTGYNLRYANINDSLMLNPGVGTFMARRHFVALQMPAAIALGGQGVGDSDFNRFVIKNGYPAWDKVGESYLRPGLLYEYAISRQLKAGLQVGLTAWAVNSANLLFGGFYLNYGFGGN